MPTLFDVINFLKKLIGKSLFQDKQKSKEGKKVAHQFVIYNGSIIVCDVCQKPFNKKQVLKCESKYVYI